MSLPTLIGCAVLIIGVPLNVYVTLRLWRLHQLAPDVPLLRLQVVVFVVILILVVVFGLIFLNNDIPRPFIALPDTKLYTRLAMLALAVVPATLILWFAHDAERER